MERKKTIIGKISNYRECRPVVMTVLVAVIMSLGTLTSSSSVSYGNNSTPTDSVTLTYAAPVSESDTLSLIGEIKKCLENGDSVSAMNLCLLIPDHPFSLNKRAAMYYYGLQGKRDFQKAFELSTKSAMLGDSIGQYNLALMWISNNDITGIERDVDRGIDLLHKSANQEYEDAQALLGKIYYSDEFGLQDYSEAFKWYERAANKGNSTCMCSLAFMYLVGIGTAQDTDKALQWATNAAENGELYALNLMSMMYISGYGVDVDYAKALELSLKAAEHGDIQAQANLGAMYGGMIESEVDYQKALEWSLKAAEQGSKTAMSNLGAMFYEGRGVEKDFNKAFEYFSNVGKDALNAENQTMFAIMYANGLGTEQSDSVALEMFIEAAGKGNVDSNSDNYSEMRSQILFYTNREVGVSVPQAFSELYKASVKDEDPNAQYLYGLLFYSGTFFWEHKGEAEKWFAKSAKMNNSFSKSKLYELLTESAIVDKSLIDLDDLEKDAIAGNSRAQYIMGQIYFHPSNIEEEDYEKALDWYTKAGEQGFAKAQERLGYMYSRSLGTDVNHKKAFEWYKKAAEQGIKSAQYEVASSYYFGSGIETDYKEAFNWFQEAADLITHAQYYLGLMFYQGLGVDQDFAKAHEWFQKSSSQWDESALMLGNMYYKGEGVERDCTKAMDLWTTAAGKGNLDAINNLGLLYYHGEGTEKDIITAKQLWEDAAKKGHKEARDNLEEYF